MSDELLTIETPEHVELQFALASLGNRFLACAIDHGLQLLAALLVWVIGYNLNFALRGVGERVASGIEEGNLWIVALMILLSYLIFSGYFAFFETIWSGQTPGKRLLKLRVIQADGRPINFFAAFARNLLRVVDSFPQPFYSIGIASVFASAQCKRIGDYVANTVVVKERAAEAPKFEEVFTSPEIDTALRRVAPAVNFRGEVRQLSEQEIELIEQFLRRRYDIPAQPRNWLAWRIGAPLLEQLHPTDEAQQFNYEGFLEEVLARRRNERRA